MKCFCYCKNVARWSSSFERVLLFLQSNAPVLSTYHKPLFPETLNRNRFLMGNGWRIEIDKESLRIPRNIFLLGSLKNSQVSFWVFGSRTLHWSSETAISIPLVGPIFEHIRRFDIVKDDQNYIEEHFPQPLLNSGPSESGYWIHLFTHRAPFETSSTQTIKKPTFTSCSRHTIHHQKFRIWRRK